MDATIGGYRILEQLGAGGMGVVWLAEHAIIGRRAAIKILHPTLSTRPEVVTRFFNEAKAATAISDPGIIQIFDFGRAADGSAYIVMELLEGESLDRRLKRLGAFAIGDALRVLRQVATSVGAAHARGITHRDLKPDNIFMVRDPEVAGGERPKILDFGIAKLAADMNQGGQHTNTSAIIGTPAYMSPEQCRGAGRVDRRSDVYSLGCMLFAMITGRPPFRARGAGDLIVQHITEAPPRASDCAAGVTREIDALILRCLAKEPAQRFDSGTELAAAIETLLSQLSATTAARIAIPAEPASEVPTTLGSSVFVTPTPSRSTVAPRRRGLIAGVASAVIVTGGGVGVALYTTKSAPDAVLDAPPVAVVPTPAPPRKPDPSAEVKTGMQAVLQAFATWADANPSAPCPTVDGLAVPLPLDPWQHAYELTCTDQPGDQKVGVVSRGPDGDRGTDDDVTSWTLGREVVAIVHGPRWQPRVAATTPPPPPTRAKPTKPARPTRPPTRPPAKPTGPIDLDGDGIPDTR